MAIKRISYYPINYGQFIPDVRVPLKLFNWSYPETDKLYTITLHNRGNAVANNIRLEIEFFPNIIRYVEINHDDRMQIIEGGKPSGSRVVFRVPELLPNELQDAEILLKDKNITSSNAWEETEGEIKNIFITDMSIEFEKSIAISSDSRD